MGQIMPHRLPPQSPPRWLRADLDFSPRGPPIRARRRCQVSFSTEVKDELAGFIGARSHCREHELLALAVGTRGRVREGADGPWMVLPSVRNVVARKVVRLIHAAGGEASVQRRSEKARQASFEVRFRLDQLLSELWARGAFVPERACDRKSLLRGFFIASGSASAPGSDYHLELVLPGEEWGTALQEALSGLGVEARPGHRAGRARLYVKEADAIARVLSLAGASRGVLEFERARVVREMAAGVNRRLNFETANIAKSVGAAQAQIAAIRRLEAQGRLPSLSPALKRAASARRSHPEASLDDLAQRLGLSRSAANHRLRRLVELAGREAKG